MKYLVKLEMATSKECMLIHAESMEEVFDKVKCWRSKLCMPAQISKIKIECLPNENFST